MSSIREFLAELWADKSGCFMFSMAVVYWLAMWIGVKRIEWADRKKHPEYYE